MEAVESPYTSARDNTLALKLQSIFADAKMPSNPTLALRIIELAEDPRSSASDFAEIIRTDPVLSARLLEKSNSALYSQIKPVTTIRRAVTVLGLRRVKTISLSFQLVRHLDKLITVPFDLRSFWQHSLLRACLSQTLACRLVPSYSEESFLVGLLQDCGTLLLVQVFGSEYADLYRSAESPTEFYTKEQSSFPYTHVDAISVMALEWHLPEIISIPLEKHHEPTELQTGSSDIEILNVINFFVGNLQYGDNMIMYPTDPELQSYGSNVLGLDNSTWTGLLTDTINEYSQVATLYGDILPKGIDVVDLLNKANSQLTAIADSTDDHITNMEVDSALIRREQKQLASALSEYRERAATDPLTNILNRGALLEIAQKILENNMHNKASVAFYFIDIDDFKQLNDTYSHAIGDDALKSLSKALVREIGDVGVVGRYGGEEFVCIVKDLSFEEARVMAERIVERVRLLDMSAIGVKRTITISLGGIWSDEADNQRTSPKEMISAADQLMYRVKRNGKNQYCFKMFSNL